jgi:hypothetical protein
MSKVSIHRGPRTPRRYRLADIERLEQERLGYIRNAYLRGEFDVDELERQIEAEMLAELPHKQRALP